MRRPGRVALWAGVTLALGGTTPAAADELTITAQAVAAHGEFLTQSPPPPTPGVLCIVDSGVDVNPDTESMLIGRESIFGGTTDDVTAYHHGTYVAMVAGGTANGWGMVGAWPHLKALSVRVLAEGDDHLSGNAYSEGIARCVAAKVGRGINVRVIELAIGGPPAGRTVDEMTQIQEAVATAGRNGIVVVSAAGNDGGPVNLPAALPGVLGVGAVDRAGAFCTFTSRGPELGLLGLGCGLDVATVPGGDAGTGQSTSLTSAYVAGVAVALSSYRPELTASETQTLLVHTATPTANGPVLDATAAFRAAGLGSLVDAYRPPPSSPAGPSPRVVTCDDRKRVCTQPRVLGATRRGRRVVIRLASLPRGVRAIVRVDHRVRQRARSRTLVVRTRRFKVISIRFTSPGKKASEPVVIRRSQVKT